MLNIIVNTNALKKYGRTLSKVEERLKERGAEYRILHANKVGDVKEYARCLSEAGEKKIIAFGGDGTLNEVLSGLVNIENCEVGLIPAGTGNDFAAAANIPRGELAVDLILDTGAQETDYIEFDDGRRSINIAGMGMDVDILQRCEEKKKRGKRGSYFSSLLSSLAHYRGLTLEVSTDGGEPTRYNCLIACVCNGKQFGGGIPICPVAKIDDGKLELQIYECPPRWKIPAYLTMLMRGTLYKKKLSHTVSCTTAKIVPVAGTSFAQYDGELKESDGLVANIVTGKLKMFRG